MEKVFITNIEENTVLNTNYRKVLHTTSKMQLVVMNIPPLDNIHLEIHPEHDQFIKVEDGICTVLIYDSNKVIINEFILYSGWCVIIPANTWHEIKNLSHASVCLYTIYTPPEHDKNRIDIINPERPSNTCIPFSPNKLINILQFTDQSHIKPNVSIHNKYRLVRI
jgi:mannose-6-phosphate isomerase-like protein (cupin superfamily)